MNAFLKACLDFLIDYAFSSNNFTNKCIHISMTLSTPLEHNYWKLIVQKLQFIRASYIFLIVMKNSYKFSCVVTNVNLCKRSHIPWIAQSINYKKFEIQFTITWILLEMKNFIHQLMVNWNIFTLLFWVTLVQSRTWKEIVFE